MASISLFDSLPVETIVHIFQLAVTNPRDALSSAYDPRSTQFALIATCRRWRKIAISDPNLWTTLFIVLPCPDERAAIIAQLVEWSSKRPLSIYAATAESYNPYNYNEPMPPFSSVPNLVQSLIPEAEVLWLDADPGLKSAESELQWFPLELPPSHKLRNMFIGPNALASLFTEERLFLSKVIPPLDDFRISSYEDHGFSMQDASPRKLYIKISHQTVGPRLFEDIEKLPRLVELSLKFTIEHAWEPTLSSATLQHLDLFLAHTSRSTQQDISVLHDLPALKCLVLRLGPKPKGLVPSEEGDGDNGFSWSLTPLPQLHTITLKPSSEDFSPSSTYEQCSCLEFFIRRADRLARLKVHHGHALGAVKGLIGPPGRFGDPICPDVRLFDITKIHGESLPESHISEISEAADRVQHLRRNLKLQWYSYRVRSRRGKLGHNES